MCVLKTEENVGCLLLCLYSLPFLWVDNGVEIMLLRSVLSCSTLYYMDDSIQKEMLIKPP